MCYFGIKCGKIGNKGLFGQTDNNYSVVSFFLNKKGLKMLFDMQQHSKQYLQQKDLEY